MLVVSGMFGSFEILTFCIVAVLLMSSMSLRMNAGGTVIILSW